MILKCRKDQKMVKIQVKCRILRCHRLKPHRKYQKIRKFRKILKILRLETKFKKASLRVIARQQKYNNAC